MCGIFGYITARSEFSSTGDRRKFVEQALIVGTVRGDDSTGMFADLAFTHKEDQRKLVMHKDVLPGYDFLTNPEFLHHFPYSDWADYRFVVGHHRSATIGGISKETAHPYREGPITLVHNGTITDMSYMKKTRYELGVGTDSHTICHNLAIADEPEEVIEGLTGPFTLVWHDARDNALRMVRNHNRPMHLAKVRNADTIYFASEGEMLYWIDTRLHIGMQEIVSLKPGYLLTFRGTGSELMVPESKEVPLYPNGRHKPNYRPRVVHGQGADQYKEWMENENSPKESGEQDYPKKTSGTASSKTAISSRRSEHVDYSGNIHVPPLTLFVSNKSIPVPDNLQEDLMYYNLSSDEFVEFVPCKLERISSVLANVWGYLRYSDSGDSSPMAICQGIPLRSWEQGQSRSWKVRPVAVRGMTEFRDVIVCRLYSTVYDTTSSLLPSERQLPKVPTSRPANFHKEGLRQPNAGDATKSADIGTDTLGKRETFRGPDNQELTEQEWNKLAAGGCVQCGLPVYPFEDHTVEWVAGATPNDPKRPFCMECQQDVESWNAGRNQGAVKH